MPEQPPLSHADRRADVSPSAAAGHTTQILETAERTESPVDETDVLSELLAGSYVGDGIAVGPWRGRRLGESYSSLRSLPDDRMSSNPAYEIAESLRSVDSWSLVSPAPSPSIRASASTGPQDYLGGRDSAPVEAYIGGRMDGSLPDDDGMRGLRRQLQEIRTMATSAEEKARRMHALMTQDYLAHRTSLNSSLNINGMSSPSESTEPTVSEFAPPVDPNNPFNVQPWDLVPTFSPIPVLLQEPSADTDDSVADEAPLMLGCVHYKRNVKVQCFDCHRWFPCRYCHDISADLPFPHQLNRKKTQNMLCMICQTPQPAAEVCSACGEYSAWYYCPKCKLWDNDSNKRIYHCDDCGICRLGEGIGRDFVHCKRCNVCISISTSAAHPCVERATEGDCPLCLVRLFESQTPVVSLPCGHYMHGECYKDLMAVTYKCPVCNKSAVNMELQWRKLDDEIDRQPMPEDDEELEELIPVASRDGPIETAEIEPATVAPTSQPRRPSNVWAGCNDCGKRSWTPFHWLGLKCQVCDSYNTNQVAPTVGHETEAERVIRQQQQHHRQHDFTGHAVLRDAGIGIEDYQERVDSALDVPQSPSQLTPSSPTSSIEQRRASGAHSPGRGRYFVQDEEQRRPSFTAPRFPTPSISNLPNLPEMPRLPRMPNLPRPSMPNIPTLASMPNMPRMPDMPRMSDIELPRFSPYEMFDAVSRSLSPMRYYLRGLDGREQEVRVGGRSANRSPTSVHSDPLAGPSTSRRKPPAGSDGNPEDQVADHEAVDFWASDGAVVSGEEDDSIHAVNDDETSSESESEESDAEMGDDEGEAGDEDEEMELFGHR